MEMNMAKFSEKLGELMELAKKKKFLWLSGWKMEMRVQKNVWQRQTFVW